MFRPIYLDNAATTPVDPRVVEAMLPWLATRYGNPASATHAYGHEARTAVEAARQQVARLVNADPGEIIWTSGATESNNLALKGAACGFEREGRHLISLPTEHKAVLDTLHFLESKGFEVTLLAPNRDGLLELGHLESALRTDTILVSVMLVNNEIGVIQDIAAIGGLCRRRGILFHVDAAQATGKVAIDVVSQNVDLMSFTAHKTYGPKGIGALYVRRELIGRVIPQMHGGGHESGLRSGTLPTHQIVGLGACFAIAGQEMVTEVTRMRTLRDKLLNGLATFDGVRTNGSLASRIANNLNISLDIARAEELIASLSDIAVSSTAACSSGDHAVSHVLRALGRDGRLAGNALRITVGRFNTEAEVDFALDYLRQKIQRYSS